MKLLVRIHGMAVSPKFGIKHLNRDDDFIQKKRLETNMSAGTLVHEEAPCRTDVIAAEAATNDMILVNVDQVMSGPKKTTPVLYLTYSDEGDAFVPQFDCAEKDKPEVLVKYQTWAQGILRRSWESGRIYQNADSISIAIVGALKLDERHMPLEMSDLLAEMSQEAPEA